MSLIFTTGRAHGVDSIKNSQGNIMNKYVPGSGVGASSVAVRRLKSVRAAVRSAPPAPTGVIPLDQIASYLRNYMTEFRNPNFYSYELDGDEYYISDGGDDMYDSGNFTTPWLLSGERYDIGDNDIESYPYAVSYATTTATTVDTDFKYVSLGYNESNDSLHPLIVMGYRVMGPVGWQIGGNAGADGGGSESHGYVYFNNIVNGFTVYAGYRHIYDAGDPNISNLIILLGHPSWGSVFGTVSLIADNNTGYSKMLMYAGTGSQNILAISILLSREDNGEPIPNSELETVIQNITNRINQSM